MELIKVVEVRSPGLENTTLFTLDPVETNRAVINGVVLKVSDPDEAVMGSVAVVVYVPEVLASP
jgi:hypothetical protein